MHGNPVYPFALSLGVSSAPGHDGHCRDVHPQSSQRHSNLEAALRTRSGRAAADAVAADGNARAFDDNSPGVDPASSRRVRCRSGRASGPRGLARVDRLGLVGRYRPRKPRLPRGAAQSPLRDRRRRREPRRAGGSAGSSNAATYGGNLRSFPHRCRRAVRHAAHDVPTVCCVGIAGRADGCRLCSNRNRRGHLVLRRPATAMPAVSQLLRQCSLRSRRWRESSSLRIRSQTRMQAREPSSPRYARRGSSSTGRRTRAKRPSSAGSAITCWIGIYRRACPRSPCTTRSLPSFQTAVKASCW